MTIIIVAVLTVFVVCESSYGWGLATHMELAESLLTNASLLATTVGVLLIKHKKDFILGNLLADVMVAKKITRRRKASHHWIGGLNLLKNARHNRTRAFAYGFLTHLAADTVAHNDFVPRQIARANSSILLGHLYWELMADQLTDPARRRQLRKILRNYPHSHDQHLETHLYSEMKWFGFNKSVFTQVNRLAHDRKFLSAVKFYSGFSNHPLHAFDLTAYKAEASARMLDILLHGPKSKFLAEDPNGCDALSEVRKQRTYSIILPG